MGGTTAKACLVEAGSPSVSNQFEVARLLSRPGTGFPLTIPSIDLVEIGAGGGSIAREHLGVIAVGPRSAGADPGPVCYGRGGTEPTVTDANLVLGYLDPGYFLGGEIRLDVDAARRAIETHVARPLGLSVEGAAAGIKRVVDARMGDLLRTSIDDLELSVRSVNSLKNSNIRTLGDLVRQTENQILQVKNFGKKSLQEIADLLEREGLNFGMRYEEAGDGGVRITDWGTAPSRAAANAPEDDDEE
jgi:hypothetical protein